MKKIITILLAAIGIMSCGNNPKQAENPKDKAWQEIAPTEIELNPVKMIDKDWQEVGSEVVTVFFVSGAHSGC